MILIEYFAGVSFFFFFFGGQWPPQRQNYFVIYEYGCYYDSDHKANTAYLYAVVCLNANVVEIASFFSPLDLLWSLTTKFLYPK